MKQIMMLCSVLFIVNTTKASSLDSLTHLSYSDTLSLQIDYLLVQAQATTQPSQTQPTTLNQFYAQANIFQKVGKAIKQAINWVAKGSGHYKEEGMKKEGTYFLFDRNANGSHNKIITLHMLVNANSF